MKRTFPFLVIFIAAFVLAAKAQTLPPGPRTAQGKAVRLTPVPLTATPAEIQALLARNHYLYFKPGSYNIGNLRIDNWQSGLIWGAGRITTQLNGSITISGSKDVTIGNFNIINNKTASDSAVLDVAG